MTGLCRALAYAHERGILHRDVKPSNILLSPGGPVCLTDFGLARIAAAGESTLSGETMIGTPQYISPEQARSIRDLDYRTDIYSAGIVLYELVVGEVPFDADTPFSVIHDHLYTPPPPPSRRATHVSPALEATILRALAKEREDRYASASEFLNDFLQAAGGSGDLGRMPDTLSRVPDAPRATSRSQPWQAGERRQRETQPRGRGGFAADDGRWIPLSGTRLLLGRDDPTRRYLPDIDLSPYEPIDPGSGRRRRTVHREQARLLWRGEAWNVEVVSGSEDRAQWNGTPMVVGKWYPLTEGDRLTFGAVNLVFRRRPAARPSPDEADTLPPGREG
jgi:serine/threonine protein kinase